MFTFKNSLKKCFLKNTTKQWLQIKYNSILKNKNCKHVGQITVLQKYSLLP